MSIVSSRVNDDRLFRRNDIGVKFMFINTDRIPLVVDVERRQILVCEGRKMFMSASFLLCNTMWREKTN
jgi:hypothetical protein